MPLMADDTEVYLGDLDFSADIRPNIVFIIDTSGSMDTDVTGTTGTYDPSPIYTGDCNRIVSTGIQAGIRRHVTRITGSRPPHCLSGCSAALTTGPGVYVGRLARYRTAIEGATAGKI